MKEERILLPGSVCLFTGLLQCMEVSSTQQDQLHPAHILGNFIVEVFSAGHLPVITFPRFPRGQISGNFQKFSVIQLCAFSNEVCISAQARDRAGEGEASSILGTPSQH